MGLVDYSESESESEAPQKAPQTPKVPPAKKPFQKVVDRSNPGKIVVNLPQETSSSAPSGDEPPAKRARTGNAGGGRFSGFNSFLPAPKNANKPGVVSSSSGKAKPRPGVNLRTSAAPGFSRDGGDEDFGIGAGSSEDMNLPAPKKQAEPTIPEGQKAAEDVKLVGKPMMFKPLSVSRNTNKKKTPKPVAAKLPTPTPSSATETSPAEPVAPTQPAPPPKKMSLFSMHTEEASEPSTLPTRSGAYEPIFETQGPAAGPERPMEEYTQAYTAGTGTESLDTIADDLNLSAAERRELFGRGGGDGQVAKKVINFNMDKEYQHNEDLRASGEEQIHNPVRAIQGGGKHSLRKLVHNVQNQRDALEDSFAKGKTNRKEASSRYGW
ncbi:hypothetical protein ACO1O0_008128 [Amphichorda felina]